MRTTVALLTVAANHAQQASVARIPTQGSFGAELQARGDSYLDLHYVRTKKRKVSMHGVLDDETQQALKTYGTTLKSDQLAAHSHNKFAIPIATDGTEPCPQNVTRHFSVKPWFWDNAWHDLGVLHAVDATRVHQTILRQFGHAGTSGTTSRRWGIGWLSLHLVMSGWRWTYFQIFLMIASSSSI